MKRSKGLVYGVILLLLVIGQQGCAEFKYQGDGRFFIDQTATEAFERFEVKPELNYYISGSDLEPTALLGLAKNYVLDTPSWKKVDMTPELLKEMVGRMKKRTSMAGQALSGFVLLDLQGKPVGIWYSIILATTSLQFSENNHVKISEPAIRD